MTDQHPYQQQTKTMMVPVRWYSRREFHLGLVFVLGMLSTFALAMISPPVFNEIYRVLFNLTH